MALGKRKREQQSAWVATTELPKSPGHPFYKKLNVLLAEADFDGWLEAALRLRITPPRWDAIRSRPAFTFAWF